ncbi:50S ribosomal protein L14e [Candidatus Woesearchaeota archaeon]|nr:50S ribosomal protein L14e [Candidatus Woesearchaeota archaeon]
MIEIGRVCMKMAGRDAGEVGVVIDIDNNFVVLDGNVRRKRCNIKHIEPLKQLLQVSKNASHEDIVAALKEAGFKVPEQKPKKTKEAKKAPVKEQKKSVAKKAKKKE